MSHIRWKAVHADFKPRERANEIVKVEERYTVKRRKFLPDIRAYRTVECRVGDTSFLHKYKEIESKIYDSYEEAESHVEKIWGGNGFAQSVDK